MAFAPSDPNPCLALLANALGPSYAYTKEGFIEDEQEFVFEVVGIDEIGVQIVDPTKTDEKGDPVGVPNVIVILTSTDDPSIPQAQKHTGDDGKCVLNINKFCPKDEQGQPEGGIFQANVSVTVTSGTGSICDYAIFGLGKSVAGRRHLQGYGPVHAHENRPLERMLVHLKRDSAGVLVENLVLAHKGEALAQVYAACGKVARHDVKVYRPLAPGT